MALLSNASGKKFLTRCTGSEARETAQSRQIHLRNGEKSMINIYEVTETNNMVEKENLDVRTITM